LYADAHRQCNYSQDEIRLNTILLVKLLDIGLMLLVHLQHIYLSACEDVYSYGKLCVATGASPKV